MRQTAEAKSFEPAPAQAHHSALERVPDSPAVTIRCYENDIPAFVAPELKRLYQSHYTTIEHFGQSGALVGVGTYIARRGHEIIAIFLFRREGRVVKVLNEAISVDEEEIRRFCSFAFSAFERAGVIWFSALHTDLQHFPFPHQKINRLEDIVASMPDGADEYTASLGKKTRSNLRRYQKIIKQEHPSFQFQALEGDAIEPEKVRAVMALYGKRLAEKNKVLFISEAAVERLIRLAIEDGLVGIVTIDGRICAGAITCRLGSHSYLRVLAHDPGYNKYSIGTLCCYLTIVECARRGTGEFHFLWGESDYKYLLGGVRRDLDRIVVYRDSMQFMLNGWLAFKSWCGGLMRRAGKWGQQARKEDRPAVRLAFAAIDFLRGLKRSKSVSFLGVALCAALCAPLDRWSERALVPFLIL